MDKPSNFPPQDEQGVNYEIKIKGRLAEHWSDWMGGMQITEAEQGNTNLVGIVPDQSALHGILAQIRNLGLDLISIRPLAYDGQREIEVDHDR